MTDTINPADRRGFLSAALPFMQRYENRTSS